MVALFFSEETARKEADAALQANITNIDNQLGDYTNSGTIDNSGKFINSGLISLEQSDISDILITTSPKGAADSSNDYIALKGSSHLVLEGAYCELGEYTTVYIGDESTLAIGGTLITSTYTITKKAGLSLFSTPTGTLSFKIESWINYALTIGILRVDSNSKITTHMYKLSKKGSVTIDVLSPAVFLMFWTNVT